MVARNPARYLAPVALLATTVATIVIVNDVTDSRHHATTARGLTRAPTRPRQTAVTPATYKVRAGDSLSSISVKTGVSVPTLEALNPSVDPAALQTGQRLRLRR
jgi:LysM repeat protein